MLHHQITLLYFNNSGLATPADGSRGQVVGSISQHQQRQGHDNIQLLAGPYDYTLSAVCCHAGRAAVPAQYVPGKVSGV